MADVFISYKREDRGRIAPLARALEARGYTVWWDLELIAGQKWAKKIKAELDAAKCVIVAWTGACVASDRTYVSEWVENEADEALRRGVLVPALMDEGRIAWTHQKVQYATLIGWTGEPNHPGLVALIDGVVQHAGLRARPEEVELAAWGQAERTETAEAFHAFLTAHPQSRFAEIARGRAAELEEAAAWAALGAAPTAAALAGFLRRFPAGRFADEAEARIHALERTPRKPATPAYEQTGAAPMSAPFRLPKWALPAAAGIVVLIAALMFVPPMLRPAGPTSTATEETAPTSSLSAGQVFRDCAECPEMVVVPAGSFMMGSPDSETGRENNEGPLHQVSVQGFAASKYEVTRGQWIAFSSTRPAVDVPVDPAAGCDTPLGDDNHPVTCISWYDAREYMDWLTQRTGHTYRLLTEAEWEYAARAGTTTPYSTGASISASQARFGSQSTAAVGSYSANRFGLHDMHGNVWEWVEDCYAESYAGHQSDGSAYETNNCSLRVLRGGAWGDDPRFLRSTHRTGSDPTIQYNGGGFRLARAL